MKYIVIPILKFVFVFVALILFPIVMLGGTFVSLWHLEKYYIQEAYDSYFSGFVKEDAMWKKSGEKYYMYMTPLDYLIGKKTFYLK